MINWLAKLFIPQPHPVTVKAWRKSCELQRMMYERDEARGK